MRFLIALIVGVIVAVGADVLDVTNRTDLSGINGMTGTWAGSAQIVVNWTVQTGLPVYLTLALDASVQGTVGDATLRNGRLKRNRTGLGRLLHIKTDWIVTGTS